MIKLLWIGIGGFLGSILRFAASQYIHRLAKNNSFPLGTLSVNIFGCFLIGFLSKFFEERFLVQPELRLFLVIGVLGGFTTFSSFSYETIALLQEGNIFQAGINIIGSIFLCLLATWLGIIVGKIS
ncbi:MAG: fluoride efflux transporter CrcB [Bacteroidetes bacterium]|nr:fluoride efflux transporter CrcB [Bacteroidota bacterium]